jgi:hypothetical protein
MSQRTLFVRTPRAKVVSQCAICGRGRILTDDPLQARHLECLAKPVPCDCGQASMPYPLCSACQGSGRIEGELCLLCPPGPCVSCVSKAMIGRVRAERDSARPETVTKSDSLSDL